MFQPPEQPDRHGDPLQPAGRFVFRQVMGQHPVPCAEKRRVHLDFWPGERVVQRFAEMGEPLLKAQRGDIAQMGEIRRADRMEDFVGPFQPRMALFYVREAMADHLHGGRVPPTGDGDGDIRVARHLLQLAGGFVALSLGSVGFGVDHPHGQPRRQGQRLPGRHNAVEDGIAGRTRGLGDPGGGLGLKPLLGLPPPGRAGFVGGPLEEGR